MKYIDTLFKFPVLLYDVVDYERRTKKEIEDDVDYNELLPFVIGYIKLPVEEINVYISSWKKGYKVQQISENEKLMSCTTVFTKTMGDFVCSWKLDNFEKKYQEHLDLIGQYVVLDINSINFEENESESK